MATYNCVHSGDQYRITKFSPDGNVESSYLCDHVACECPAGVRDTCRHRQMLPTFLFHNLINSHLFLNWDNGRRIVDFQGNTAIQPATVQSDETHIGDNWRELVRAVEIETTKVQPIDDGCGKAVTTPWAPELFELDAGLHNLAFPEPSLTAEQQAPIDHLAPQALTDTIDRPAPPLNIDNWRELSRIATIEFDEIKPAEPTKPATSWRRF